MSEDESSLKKLTFTQNLCLHLFLFGSSWLTGTAIGWGIQQNPLTTFLGIGFVPLIMVSILIIVERY